MSNDVANILKDIRKNEIEQHLNSIKKMYEELESFNKSIVEENRKLKEEYDKDEEIQKMKTEIKKIRQDYYRGFPISAEDAERMDEWKIQHEQKVHGLYTLEDRLRAGGTVGGRYSYHFVPTSIGTSGTIRCSCGAEFEFQEIV